MADLFSVFKGWGTSIKEGWIWILYIALIGIFFAFIITIIKNKAMYKYPVRIFRVREGNKVKELNCKGGYITRKNSAPFFRIKLGKWWWQYVELSTTPNPAFMDEQDRIYYKQIDVKTYIQLRRIFSNKDAIVEYTPVECDVKYGAILDIHRIKDVLKTESTWSKIAPYFSLVLLFIAAILGWNFVMNSKCPAPPAAVPGIIFLVIKNLKYKKLIRL